ncbi:hypothetical protein [Microtetraspora malaysiensis]|uniref:Uncharacterized protein n=1 Tax=Microtetraspora malaysiensis TaxID=161358 RepID=A0ABW6T7V3_9ACTN
MAARQRPRLVDVFPDLAADIIALLRAEDENDPLWVTSPRVV